MFSFLDFIFPARCLGCKKEGEFICEKCFQKIQLKKFQKCPICKMKINGGEVCQKCRKKSALSGLLVATNYEQNSLVKKMVTQFKYKFNESLSEKLVELLLGVFGSEGELDSSTHSTFINFFKEELAQDDDGMVLVPVPLHFLRKWKRGFNQAELLAKQVSKKTGIPVVNLLKRIRNTPQQAKLKRAERLKNLKGAFGVNKKKLRIMSCEFREGNFDKKLPTILLVDDIASTLTTLEESARTLRKAGFKNVWGMVVARG